MPHSLFFHVRHLPTQKSGNGIGAIEGEVLVTSETFCARRSCPACPLPPVIQFSALILRLFFLHASRRFIHWELFLHVVRDPQSEDPVSPHLVHPTSDISYISKWKAENWRRWRQDSESCVCSIEITESSLREEETSQTTSVMDGVQFRWHQA